MGEGIEQLIFRFFILKFNYASSSQNDNPIYLNATIIAQNRVFKQKLNILNILK